MIDDRTANFGWPKPHGQNNPRTEDVERLRSVIDQVDEKMAEVVSGSTKSIASVAAATSYTPAPEDMPDVVQVGGRSAPGDSPAAHFVKVGAAEPLRGPKFSMTAKDGSSTFWYKSAAEEYTPEMFGQIGASAATNADIVKDALECAAFDGRKFGFKAGRSYPFAFAAVALTGPLHIAGNGATLVNMDQTPDGTTDAGRPILLLDGGGIGGTEGDVSVDRLFLTGPRNIDDGPETASIFGVGRFDIPYGLVIASAGDVNISHCVASGFYQDVILVEFAKTVMAFRNVVTNGGRGGLMVSDAEEVSYLFNRTADHGHTWGLAGYGLSAKTSADHPTYSRGTRVVNMHGNTAYRCKRRCLDVHDALNAIITGNYCKGFGLAAGRLVGESASKRIERGIVTANIIEGDPVWAAGQKASYVWSFGNQGAGVDQRKVQFEFGSNMIRNVDTLSHMIVDWRSDKADGSADTTALSVHDVIIEGGSCQSIFGPNVASSRSQKTRIDRITARGVTTSSYPIVIVATDDSEVTNCTIDGTIATATMISGAGSQRRLVRNNHLAGVRQMDQDRSTENKRYSHYIGRTVVDAQVETGGSALDLNLFKVRLDGAASLNARVDVKVKAQKFANSGANDFAYTAVGYRNGTNPPLFVPAAATAMTAGAAIYGTAAAAPTLEWVDAGGGYMDLVLHLNQANCDHIIVAEATGWRGVIEKP